jgi:hypothetical protein
MTKDIGMIKIGLYPLEKRSFDISLRFQHDLLNEKQALSIHTPLNLI